MDKLKNGRPRGDPNQPLAPASEAPEQKPARLGGEPVEMETDEEKRVLGTLSP